LPTFPAWARRRANEKRLVAGFEILRRNRKAGRNETAVLGVTRAVKKAHSPNMAE
jgi:hypothetical protein